MTIDAAASVSQEIGMSVARLTLDQAEAQGEAVNSMIEAAIDVQDQQMVKDGRLDVYA